jgi:flagellar capping protein FliD
LQSRIKSFDRQIEDRERRLDNYERLLVARFSALESTMAQLQAQQQYLISTTQ